MLRLTDIKLDLDHAEGEIKAAVLKRLDLKPQELLGYSVYRRAVDARKRSAIALIYTLDIEVRNEAALLQRFARDRNVAPAPDEGYRLKARAPEAPASRLVVIGTGPAAAGGPCAGADGLPAADPRARQGRARTPRKTPGACGVGRCSTRNRMCNSAKAAPARSPTASSTARSRTRITTAARC